MIAVQSCVKYDDETDFQASLDDSFEWLLLGESSQKASLLILKDFVSSARASSVGYEAIYLFGHYFRNAAQAVEAWTKGIICCRRSLIADDLNHDLSILFADCRLTAARPKLLDKLQHYLKWAGRYPTPRKSKDAVDEPPHEWWTPR
jgi:hypothetical protein